MAKPMKSRVRRGRGRPPKPEGAMRQISIRFPVEMIEALDEMAAGRMDKPDRVIVIREILAKAIEAHQKARK